MSDWLIWGAVALVLVVAVVVAVQRDSRARRRRRERWGRQACWVYLQRLPEANLRRGTES